MVRRINLYRRANTLFSIIIEQLELTPGTTYGDLVDSLRELGQKVPDYHQAIAQISEKQQKEGLPDFD